jgi:hypothetical protein
MREAKLESQPMRDSDFITYRCDQLGDSLCPSNVN